MVSGVTNIALSVSFTCVIEIEQTILITIVVFDLFTPMFFENRNSCWKKEIALQPNQYTLT